MTAKVQMNHSWTGSLIQATAPYTLVQESDEWDAKSVKYTLGTAAHALQTVMALVELVITAALLTLAKTGQFFVPKYSSTWVDANLLNPLAQSTFDTNVSLLIAASRIVTNFLGHETVQSTDQAIEAKLTQVYSSAFVKAIKRLHINGFTLELERTSQQESTSRPEDLILFFERLEISEDKPAFTGTPEEQAQNIRAWMEGNPSALTSISALDLSGLKLESVPPEMGQLRQLSELNLSENQLSSLPSEFWQLSNLQRLYLQRNQLTALPQDIGKLSKLVELNVNHNQLKSIPAAIGELPRLREFSCKNNQLTALPQRFCYPLGTLTSLCLSRNQLQSLPAEIGELQHLTSLDLKNNQLTTLPAELAKLRKLTECFLQGNPVCNDPSTLPQEVLKMAKFKSIFQFRSLD